MKKHQAKPKTAGNTSIRKDMQIRGLRVQFGQSTDQKLLESFVEKAQPGQQQMYNEDRIGWSFSGKQS
jgi:hypothetical protein